MYLHGCNQRLFRACVVLFTLLVDWPYSLFLQVVLRVLC